MDRLAANSCAGQNVTTLGEMRRSPHATILRKLDIFIVRVQHTQYVGEKNKDGCVVSKAGKKWKKVSVRESAIQNYCRNERKESLCVFLNVPQRHR